jgi:hypothetical protein
MVQGPENLYPGGILAGFLFYLRAVKKHPFFHLLRFHVFDHPFHLSPQNKQIYTELVGFCC